MQVRMKVVVISTITMILIHVLIQIRVHVRISNMTIVITYTITYVIDSVGKRGTPLRGKKELTVPLFCVTCAHPFLYLLPLFCTCYY